MARTTSLSRAFRLVAERSRRPLRPWRDAPGLPWSEDIFAESFLSSEELPLSTAFDEAQYIMRTLGNGLCGVLVEVGCGGGRTLRELMVQLDDRPVTLLGIDVGQPPLQRMRRRCGRGVEAVRGDMCALPLRVGSASFLMCVFGGFLHLPSKSLRRAVREWRRVIDVGGHVLLEYPAPSLLRGLDSTRDWWIGESSYAGIFPQLGLSHNRVTSDGRYLIRRDFVVDIQQGEVHEFSSTCRIWDPEDLAIILERCSFALRTVDGDWTGVAYDDSSPRVILTAVRKS